MLFNSPIFLFVFLPLVLFVLLIKKVSIQNAILVIFSLLFYAWGGVSYSIILIASVLLNYAGGVIIGKQKADSRKLVALQIFVAVNLLLLAYCKYANFIVDNINWLLQKEGIEPLKNNKINLPIGISFYTFHAISYLVDIYRDKVKSQKNILNLALYFMFFPQLIAGPIVRYHNISAQLINRTLSIDKFYEGIKRFVFGLSKKVLIANTFALIADEIFNNLSLNTDIYLAWLGALSYTIQIYFDFSGYSDMAIGLALMFGFVFPENFNLPYISSSIKEFWQRWHISLSTWFKDYLYIPIGGSKNGNFNTYRNLLIVFVCTGFWHGASYNFLIWGLFHGAFIILERTGIIDTLVPNTFLKKVYTMMVVVIAWVFFRADTLSNATLVLKAMFGFSHVSANIFPVLYYINLEVLIVAICAIFLMFGWHLKLYSYRFSNKLDKVILVLKPLYLVAIFVLCLVYIGASTYNSFIYFRF